MASFVGYYNILKFLPSKQMLAVLQCSDTIKILDMNHTFYNFCRKLLIAFLTSSPGREFGYVFEAVKVSKYQRCLMNHHCPSRWAC